MCESNSFRTTLILHPASREGHSTGSSSHLLRWACCLLLLEPVLEAGLTEVLSTTASEVRVTENLCADIAMELFRDWFGECEVVSTMLSLVRDVCYCHFKSVRLKSVVSVWG